MVRFLSALLLLVLTLVPFSTVQAETDAGQKAVLVTGASTGLGRAMTEMMASQGYFVYAGARKDRDLQELNAIENVQAVRLDVTKQDEIDAAVKTITDQGRGLYGLVNNAGVVVFNPLIEISEEDFDFQMNVNVYGVYRITRAFAPLIIESRGRISIIGSTSGTLSSATWGPYSMSKHAMEAYADALADEMRRFDVKVSLVEPGTYQSNIGANAAHRMTKRSQGSNESQYQADVEESIEWATTTLANSGDPSEVAEAVMDALFDEDPKPRYLVVPNQEQAQWTINRAIERMAEQNRDHKYSYDRAALVDMLDKALSGKSAELPDFPEAFDAGWQGEKTCKLLYETATVRAARCIFPPGVGHEKHFHYPHYGYVLEGGKMSITDEAGVTRKQQTTSGKSWSTDKITVHEILNIGDTTTSYLIVEPRQ